MCLLKQVKCIIGALKCHSFIYKSKSFYVVIKIQIYSRMLYVHYTLLLLLLCHCVVFCHTHAHIILFCSNTQKNNFYLNLKMYIITASDLQWILNPVLGAVSSSKCEVPTLLPTYSLLIWSMCFSNCKISIILLNIFHSCSTIVTSAQCCWSL